MNASALVQLRAAADRMQFANALYDELKEGQYSSADSLDLARIKMAFAREEVLKATFQVKRALHDLQKNLIE